MLFTGRVTELIATFEAEVILPFASTVYDPLYVPAVTPVDGKPSVILPDEVIGDPVTLKSEDEIPTLVTAGLAATHETLVPSVCRNFPALPDCDGNTALINVFERVAVFTVLKSTVKLAIKLQNRPWFAEVLP